MLLDLTSTQMGCYFPLMTTSAAAVAATAAAVRAAIERAGLSEVEAARRAGISQSTLSRRLLGNPPGFTVTELSLLAAVLGTDASSLVRQGAAA